MKSFAAVLVFFCMAHLSGAALAGAEKARPRTVYLPVYSDVHHMEKSREFGLAITVSIRNTDPRHNITIDSVRYFDSKGKLVQEFLAKPLTLRPLASHRLVVEENDSRGGPTPCFVIVWQSEAKVSPVLVEGIMISTKASQGLSFITRGREILLEKD